MIGNTSGQRRNKITRRGFLRTSGLASAGLATAATGLAGCTGGNRTGGDAGSGGVQQTLKGPFRPSAIPNAPAPPKNPAALSTGGVVPGPPGYRLPLVDPGSVTFTFAGRDNGYAPRSLTLGLPVWKEIERRTGVSINWQVTASDQYDDSMAPRMGSGRDLPDMLSLPEGWDQVKASNAGLIVAISDYIDEENTPNIQRFFKQFPDVRKYFTAPDGKIYALGSVSADAGYSDPFGLIIRQDWLDKLGLDEPGTLDEWYQVLKAFRTGDPNGNGKQDEIPYFAASQGGSSNPLEVLFAFGGAFGLHLQYSGGWYVQDSGKVYYEWIDPRIRELLAWGSKLYREKLIDQDFHNSTGDESRKKVSRNLAGAAADFSNRTVEYNNLQAAAGQHEANWVTVKPPRSDRVHQPYYEIYGTPANPGGMAISKDCKNPKLAAKWMDYIWASDEGNTLLCYGVEGLTYTVGKDKRLQFTKWVTNNPQSLDPNSSVRYYGSMPYTTSWVRAATGPLSEFSWDITRTDKRWLASAEKIASYMVPVLPQMLSTSEDSKVLASVTTDMDTYRNETLLKFVLGQTELTTDSWNEYVSTLSGMGLDQVIEIQQRNYERFAK